ncbi:MAG: PorV/PorQ family protein [Candidatus Marinimicrobia bacterium]|nr:PorV/PorQ family protein [Candidatus Neomarinimicrobiota bacterium]MCF7905311.1 PorV/PorQ family protein [Candidatus Neomarinimicrobiota bacterium]
MKSNKIALFLIALLVVSAAFAGTGKSVGTYGALELVIPTGAKSVALSGSNMATVAGADAMFYNPAGIAKLTTNMEAQLSNLNYLADIGVSYGALVAKVGNNTVGVSAKTLNFGDILHTTAEDPNGYQESYFSPKYITLSGSFARMFFDRVGFGATFKMISETFIQTSASGVAFDMGVQYKSATMPLSIGVTLKNIGVKMKFAGSDLEQKLAPEDSEEGTILENFAVVAQGFEIPASLDIGLTYTVMNMINIHGVFKNNSFGFNEYRLGADYSMKTDMLSAWAGGGTSMYSVDDDTEGWDDAITENPFGISFGAGVMIPISNFNLGVEYGYKSTAIGGLDDLSVIAFTFGF